jgi:hypothetical protein
MTVPTLRLALPALLAAALCNVPVRLDAQGAPGLPAPGQPPPRPGAAPGMPGAPGMPAGPGTPGRPPRDPRAPKPTGTGVVSGRVVAADTGQPLRRARVFLHGRNYSEGYSTVSNADGTFTIENLPADRYQLRGSKARYVDTTLGSRRPGGQGRPFELGDGQRLENVVLALSSAGVIVGRVLDDVGEPVVGAPVAALRFRSFNGTRQPMPTSRPAMTDDTGAFRLYGLAPGRYYVSAQPDESFRFGPAENTNTTSGYATTFYPSTPAIGDAQEIEVTAGGEAAADIILVASRIAKVSGSVVDATGRPARGGMIMTFQKGGGINMGMAGGQSIKPEGTFTLTGVTPGEYTLSIRATFGDEDMARAFAGGAGFSVPLVVSGADISDLRITVPEPITIAGRVVFEGGTPTAKDNVGISLANPSSMMDGASARAGADGRFTLNAMPGTRRLTAWSSPGWMVKRVLWRGREVEPQDDVEVTAEAGARIDVVVTNSVSVVDGSVTDERGRTLTDYQVVIFPEDLEVVRRSGMRRVRFERPDQQGRFRVESLPPGRYLAVAVTDLDPDEASEVETLETFKPAGTAVVVDEGRTSTLTLKLATLP